jgi:predicted nuclease of restriction endonuclease-like (RecB) superfamily
MSKQPQKAQNMQSEFSDVLKQIQESRQQVFARVNTALIDLYWQIGQIISQKVNSEAWGKSVVSELAQYITQNAPEIKGFSDKNLWRMKQFYETYQSDPKLSPLVRELPWTHNTIIFHAVNLPKSGNIICVCASKNTIQNESWNDRLVLPTLNGRCLATKKSRQC